MRAAGKSVTCDSRNGDGSTSDERRNRCISELCSPGQTRRERAFIKTVEKVSGHSRLRRLYKRYCNERGLPQYGNETLFDSAVRLLDVDVRYDVEALERTPRDRPVLFIANHPYGVIDGIVLTWLSLKVRPDVKVVTINALNRAPEVKAYCLPVDFSGTPKCLTERGLSDIRSLWFHRIASFEGDHNGLDRYRRH